MLGHGTFCCLKLQSSTNKSCAVESMLSPLAGIMAAVMNVPWPISTEYGEESRYNTLLQISIGQEEVDEVITRDIHRTFPEHPQFGFAQGQQALFRVLKAYSLHDLEVRPPLSIAGRAFCGCHGILVQLNLE
jgi:hypothetical protein